MMSIDIHFTKPFVLYDSDCLLCSRFIQFILRNEKDEILYFAALDSSIAEEILKKTTKSSFPDSVVFYKDGNVEYASRAVLSIAAYLKRPFSYVSLFRFIPTLFLDHIYRLVAGGRYRIFGKTTTPCSVLQPEQAHRFYS